MKKIFKISIIVISSCFLILFVFEVLGRLNLINQEAYYDVSRYLTYSEEDWANYEKNMKIYDESMKMYKKNKKAIDVALPSPQEPIDTTWNKPRKDDELFNENYKSYIKTDFSKLIKATVKPTNKEAQEAIVRYFKDDVVKLLEENKATIRIGISYNAPLQNNENGNNEIYRVTAMVSGFTKDGTNLGNMGRPLRTVYDFVKFEEDSDNWYLAQFSQTIPYDYILNKERW